jgi:TolB-like protein
VGILPFDAAGGDAALRLLGSELADLLRDRLAAAPDLPTILIGAHWLDRAAVEPPHLVWRQLRLGQLITGRCHRTATGIGLFIEMSEAGEGKVLWARFVRADARELLAPGSATLSALHDDLAHALRTRAGPRGLC